MKKFCSSLNDHTTNVIKKRQLILHQNVTACYICGRRFLKTFAKDKNYLKVKDHYHFTGKYRGAAHSICSLWFNEIPDVFHSGSNYDYHFMIKLLENKFDKQFKCLGKKQKNTKVFLLKQKKIRKVD